MNRWPVIPEVFSIYSLQFDFLYLRLRFQILTNLANILTISRDFKTGSFIFKVLTEKKLDIAVKKVG